MTRRKTLLRALAPLCLSALVLGACGDDDGDADTATTPAEDLQDTEGTDADDGAVAGEEVDTDGYCDQLIGIQTLLNTGPAQGGEEPADGGEGAGGATEEEQPAEGAADGEGVEPAEPEEPLEGEAPPEAFVTEVEDRLQELEANAPDEITDDVETASASVRDALETGEEPFFDPEFREASSNIDEWMLDECGYEEYEITGTEYAFEGVPDEVASGEPVALRFVNEGDEVHEMVVFRILDEEVGIEELLEMPEEEAQQMAEFAAGAFAGPGEEHVAFAELQPGRYGIVCFVPVGTTEMPDDPEAEPEGDGPPHFTEGMHAEFTVS
jgi:hypothetical protein